MLNLIGSASIVAALLGALAVAVTGVWGGFTRRPGLVRAAWKAEPEFNGPLWKFR